MEIHNNLYLKSERHLSPSSLPPSRRDSQRGGGGGGGGGGTSSRARSSLPAYVSPIMFNNPVTHTNFGPGSTYQHLPMGPLRSNSIASHCDIHSYTAVHSGETYTQYTCKNNDLSTSHRCPSVTLMSSRYVYRVHHLTVASDHSNVSIKFKGPFNCSDCVPCQLSCSLMCCLTQQRPLLSAAPHPKRPLPVVERYPRPCRRQ